jgi:hypothetical protein
MIAPVTESLPTTVDWLWGTNTRVNGGPIAQVDSPSFEGGSGWYHNPPAINDESYKDVSLKAGSYQLRLTGAKDTGYGITHVLLNGTQVGTIDWYSTALQFNQKPVISFNIPSDGKHRLSFRMASKNPAGTNYAYVISRGEVAPFF